MESVPTKVIGRVTLISSLYFGQSQFFVKPMAILSDGDNGIYYSTRCNGFTFRQFNTAGVIHPTKISGNFGPNSMDRFGPTGKVSKKLGHLLRWTNFPGRTGWNFG